MSNDPNIAERELEDLLSGRAEARDVNLGLARFVNDLRATFPADAPASDIHLAAIMESAHLFADNGDPVVRPASNADAPVPQVSRLPKRKDHHMKERRLRTLVLRVAAPVVALFTVLGIMGSAGALPRGLQRMTSNAAGLVGFDLPSGEDTEGDTDATADDQGENDDGQGDTKDDAAVDDDQGENDDSQGDSTDSTNEDDQGENDDSQGDSTDSTNEDDQGENDQGSTTNEDDQGDNSQDDTSSDGGSSQDDQGDSGSGDQGDDPGSGDNNQN
jgi:hypothetical protein